jgi:hypothetical protein
MTRNNQLAMRWLAVLLISLTMAAAAEQSELKLLISIEETKVTAPNPARLTLHFHNAGSQAVWLYTPVHDATVPSEASNPFATEDFGPSLTSGGSTLEVQLQPPGAVAGNPDEAVGRVKVFDSVQPALAKLVAIAPGEDFEEKITVQLLPAAGDGEGAKSQPRWGRYAISATYGAQYSNGQNLRRILDANLWEGEITSNRIEVEIAPPPASAEGIVEGTALGSDMRAALGAVISLSDQQERPLAQTSPDDDGKFQFKHLTPGFYWVKARRRSSPVNRTVFRHVELTSATHDSFVELVLLNEEVHHARLLRHKPVLFKVLGSNDQPLGDVSLDAAWSSGTVLDKAKGQTAADGSATLELIPGRNYVTLRHKGCPKQEERLDVAPGSGVDGFKVVFQCAKR